MASTVPVLSPRSRATRPVRTRSGAGRCGSLSSSETPLTPPSPSWRTIQRTNAPLWWAFLGSDGYTIPAPTFTIDPQQIRGSLGARRRSKWWDGALYLPGAGCYTLSASWPGGGWTATFARANDASSARIVLVYTKATLVHSFVRRTKLTL